MPYWQILLIERGYYHRNVLQYQLQRLQAYGSVHCMSGDKAGKGPDGWMPLYFDHYRTSNKTPISKEEQDELQAEMAAMNAANS